MSFDLAHRCSAWFSYFDLLGFANRIVDSPLEDVIEDVLYVLQEQRLQAETFGSVRTAWFSDTFLFYTFDNSRSSFQALDHASRWFFEELVLAGVPVRGAMACGEFYADTTQNAFLGKALVNAAKYGEKFNWLGFVLHGSALKRMEEVGQPVVELHYKCWEAEFRDRKTGKYGKECVFACCLGMSESGPGSPMAVAGGNPYIAEIEALASQAECASYRRKYDNTLEFLRFYANDSNWRARKTKFPSPIREGTT